MGTLDLSSQIGELQGSACDVGERVWSNPFFPGVTYWQLAPHWRICSCGVLHLGRRRRCLILGISYKKVLPCWVKVGWARRASLGDQGGSLPLTVRVAEGLKAWPPVFEGPPSLGPWTDLLSGSLPTPRMASQMNPSRIPPHRWIQTSAPLPPDTEGGTGQTEKAGLAEKGEILLTSHKGTLGADRRGCWEEGEGAPLDKAVFCFPSPEQGPWTRLRYKTPISASDRMFPWNETI